MMFWGMSETVIDNPFSPLMGLAGMGSLAGDEEGYYAGTEFQLTANLIDNISARFAYVPQSSLDLIANTLRSYAYDIVSYTSNYSQVIFDVVNRVDKINRNSPVGNAVVTDFTNAIANAGQNVGFFDAKFWPTNVDVKVIRRPAGSNPPTVVIAPSPSPSIVSSGADNQTQPGVASEIAQQRARDALDGNPNAHYWPDGTPNKTGIQSLDKFLTGSYFGGAVTGGLIVGIAGIIAAWKLLK